MRILSENEIEFWVKLEILTKMKLGLLLDQHHLVYLSQPHILIIQSRSHLQANIPNLRNPLYQWLSESSLASQNPLKQGHVQSYSMDTTKVIPTYVKFSHSLVYLILTQQQVILLFLHQSLILILYQNFHSYSLSIKKILPIFSL